MESHSWILFISKAMTLAFLPLHPLGHFVRVGLCSTPVVQTGTSKSAMAQLDIGVPKYTVSTAAYAEPLAKNSVCVFVSVCV